MIEGISLLSLPENTVKPSSYLEEFINKNLQLAIALDTEKARSQLIICPLRLALKEAFSEEFNVEAETGLTGVCDFILSCSKEQLFVKAPVAVIVEAKKHAS